MKQTNRRDLLKAVLAGGACAFYGNRLSAAFVPSAADLAPALLNNRLLYIFLRGGNDGTNTVVPVGDLSYATMRPNINIASSALALNGSTFAKAHPALQQLVGLGSPDALGRIAWLHQVGNPLGTRSHFYEMDAQESLDVPDPTLNEKLNPEGWVARLAGWQNWTGTLPATGLASFFRAFHAPASLAGSKIVGEIRDVDDYDLDNGFPSPAPIDGHLATLLGPHVAAGGYTGVVGDAAEYADFALKSMALVDTLPNFAPGSPTYSTAGIVDPASLFFLEQVYDAMRLLYFVPECRIVGVNFGGFDTHADQLVRQDALLRALASALRFVHDMSVFQGAAFDDSMLTLVVSEFGRTAKDNGTSSGGGIDTHAGTDHGLANLFMALGKLVFGGVRNCDGITWGNLLATQAAKPATAVDSNALPVRTDFRAVYAEILQKWFGVPPVRLSKILLDLAEPNPPTLTQLGFLP
jgi:uncharacterized protein (DUF1501 family)